MARTKGMHKLSNVTLNEVSLVGKGDNPHAHVVLLKTKKQQINEFKKEYNGANKKTLLKQWYDDNISTIMKDSECTAETFDEIIQDRKLRDEVWEMIWVLQDSISSIVNDDATTDKEAKTKETVSQFQQAVSALFKKGGKEEMAKTVEELEKALADEQAKNAELTKQVAEQADAIAKAKAPAEDGTCKTCGSKVKKEEEIDKSALPESVRKHLELLEKDQKDNADKIAKMQDENIAKECIEKATAIPAAGDVTTVSAFLKELTGVSKELAEKGFTLLKTAHTRIVEGGLFKEEGKEGHEEGVTAIDKINKLANDMVAADATGKTTFAVAFDKVYATNHELRKAYQAER